MYILQLVDKTFKSLQDVYFSAWEIEQLHFFQIAFFLCL